MDSTNLEIEFENEVLGICKLSKEIGYNPTRFLQMITEYGAVETAHQLIGKLVVSEGLETLWELKRLDLSLEYLVLQPRFRELFREDELDICRDRLKAYGMELREE